MVKPVIFQIVGYQNSGKTTFITKLIQVLNDLSIKTATIKHHGHGGKPDTHIEKDSEKHLTAGAVATLVEGDGRLILQSENNVSELDQQLALLSYFQTDVILIEGHKQRDYPKLIMIRDNKDLSLLSLSNIKAVICWENKENYKDDIRDIPVYSINDEAIYSWLISYLQKNIQDTN